MIRYDPYTDRFIDTDKVTVTYTTDRTICENPYYAKVWQDENPKQTNADRIRAMTDEELAEVISGLGDCDTCYLYHRRCSLNTSCKDAVLEWLRKDADEKTIRKTEENADTFQQN